MNTDTLTVSLKGKLDTTTIPAIEESIFEQINNSSFDNLVIDFSDVTYISSIGLRTMLKLSKEYQLSIENVSPDVYETFEITGFTKIIDVQKTLRSISLDNAKLIGSGYFSNVYRLEGDTIVKVFIRDTSIENIHREQLLAKEAFLSGIPTAITYDIVKVDGKYGVIFESIDGGTLTWQITNNPDKLDEYITDYADLLKTIDSTVPTASTQKLINMADFANEKLDVIKGHITAEEYAKSKELLRKLERTNTYLHSDCHTGNIMIQNGEYLLIDMDTLCTGNPVFELAAMYFTYIIFEDYEPGNSEKFMHLTADVARQLFYTTVRKYMGSISDFAYEENLKKVKFLGYLHALFWNLTYKPEDTDFFNFNYPKFSECLSVIDDLNLIV